MMQGHRTATAATAGSERQRKHLIEWIALVGEGDRERARKRLLTGLDAMPGDHGETLDVKVHERFVFGLWKPSEPLPLTTWSFHQDKDYFCFVEGTLYDDFCSHETQEGQDSDLARVIIGKFRESGVAVLDQLNGAFRGFIYDFRQDQAITFIDRLGAKTLYWSSNRGELTVSTSLAAFRGLRSVEMDAVAAFQFLTIGIPVGQRTLIKDVMIHMPCTVNVFDGRGMASRRYWKAPERMRMSRSLDEAERIHVAMEHHVERVHRRLRQPVALGLSGGHDSRIILSALAYRDIPFVPVTWKDGNFNDSVVTELCRAVGKTAVFLDGISEEELRKIQGDVFAYSDGYYLHPSGFSRLAKRSAQEGAGCLMLGFSGDRLSGSATIPVPEHLGSVSRLAKSALSSQMEILDFGNAQMILKADEAIVGETLTEWRESFELERSREYLSDVFLWQVLANRNLKRIRFGMIPALRYSQVVFPYLDSEVLDAYFSLPIDLLHYQRAHCRAGFYRFSEFGRQRACSYPLSLKQESRLSAGLYLLRLIMAAATGPISKMLHNGRKGVWGQRHHEIAHEIAQSPLYDAGVFGEWFQNRAITNGMLYKIHTLSRFFDSFIAGNIGSPES